MHSLRKTEYTKDSGPAIRCGSILETTHERVPYSPAPIILKGIQKNMIGTYAVMREGKAIMGKDRRFWIRLFGFKLQIRITHNKWES